MAQDGVTLTISGSSTITAATANTVSNWNGDAVTSGVACRFDPSDTHQHSYVDVLPVPGNSPKEKPMRGVYQVYIIDPETGKIGRAHV